MLWQHVLLCKLYAAENASEYSQAHSKLSVGDPDLLATVEIYTVVPNKGARCLAYGAMFIHK